MQVKEHVDNFYEEEGTIRRKHQYKVKGDLKFSVGVSLEEVPEPLRGRLHWIDTWLSLRLQDLVIILAKEME